MGWIHLVFVFTIIYSSNAQGPPTDPTVPTVADLKPILPLEACRLEHELSAADKQDALEADVISTRPVCNTRWPVLTNRWPFNCGYFCTCLRHGFPVCYEDRYQCCRRCQQQYYVCLCRGYSKYYCYQRALDCLCRCNKRYYCHRLSPFEDARDDASIEDAEGM